MGYSGVFLRWVKANYPEYSKDDIDHCRLPLDADHDMENLMRDFCIYVDNKRYMEYRMEIEKKNGRDAQYLR